jgi:hypothetical protein
MDPTATSRYPAPSRGRRESTAAAALAVVASIKLKRDQERRTSKPPPPGRRVSRTPSPPPSPPPEPRLTGPWRPGPPKKLGSYSRFVDADMALVQRAAEADPGVMGITFENSAMTAYRRRYDAARQTGADPTLIPYPSEIEIVDADEGAPLPVFIYRKPPVGKDAPPPPSLMRRFRAASLAASFTAVARPPPRRLSVPFMPRGKPEGPGE